ncbi:putative secreted protein (Por secretion system target) [Taibaiella chishuiensis]|uniref:Putative secreted protein (Por secretion system target) n=2 Tax=Taibaiella chishuiensis TaxID=1434707 RepID=A0A2P8DA48_9BACT|nr:putative secreted protein (Por secretion system target) [Taibaiella chishuiensis]
MFAVLCYCLLLKKQITLFPNFMLRETRKAPNRVGTTQTPINRMKTLKIAAVALLGLAALTPATGNAQTGIIVHDLSTGVVNGSTSLIAYGSPDDTWQVGKPDRPLGFQTPSVCTNLSSWAVNGCGRWITPYLDGTGPSSNTQAGTYNYRTAFTLNYHCFPWAKVTFSYLGGDNNVTGFSINGHSYPLSPATANDFNPLAQNIVINLDPSHLVIGSNEILVQVHNSESWTGFYACGNVSVGYCSRPGRNDQQGVMDVPASFSVAPNPSTGRVTIAMDRAKTGQAVLTDITGRIVRQVGLNGDATQYVLDLSGERKGLYILTVRTAESTAVRKLTLQ